MIGKLTEKQKRFVEEYLVDLNATQAAKRAGYSLKTASRIGPELLGKTCIQEELQIRQKAREKRTEVTQDRVLLELSKIAFSEITDYLEVKKIEEKPEEALTDKIVNIFNTADIEKEKIGAISEVKQTKDGISLKLHDKVKSLELLGKHLGMFVDRQTDLSKDLNLNVKIDYGDD